MRCRQPSWSFVRWPFQSWKDKLVVSDRVWLLRDRASSIASWQGGWEWVQIMHPILKCLYSCNTEFELAIQSNPVVPSCSLLAFASSSRLRRFASRHLLLALTAISVRTLGDKLTLRTLCIVCKMRLDMCNGPSTTFVMTW